jgi:hypothetical protein
MPGYIKKSSKSINIKRLERPNIAHTLLPRNNMVRHRKHPPPADTSKKVLLEEIKLIQRVVGSILYYACAIDSTVLMALSSIAIDQSKATVTTMGRAKQKLDYLATLPMPPFVSIPST